MIRILLADDHQMVLDALGFILELQKDMKVVGKASNGVEVLEILKKKAPDVDITILDVRMPGMDGVEAAKRIKKVHPKARILMLTGYSEAHFISPLIRIGVSGYMLKDRGEKELVGAVREIAGGKRYFGDSISQALYNELNKRGRATLFDPPELTRREKGVLQLIAKGKTTLDIAEAFFIAVTTVRKHRQNIMEKTNTHNVVELIRFAEEYGLLEE